MKRSSNRLTCLSPGRLSAGLLPTACVLVSLGCSSSGSGGPTPLGAAGMRWIPGTGNVAGEIGAGGAGGARAFPTQACLDKATRAAGDDDRRRKDRAAPSGRAREHQRRRHHPVRRRLRLQPGRLGAHHEHAHRLGRHDRRVPQGVVREPPEDPGHLRPGRRSRRRPRQGRHRLPAQHRARRHARSGAGRGGGGAPWPRRRPAWAPTSRSRRWWRWRATSAGGAPTKRSARPSSSRRRWASPTRTASRSAAAPFTVLANAKHYLGDGGTANGVNNADTSGDETALRALHLAPYQAVGRGRRRIDHGVVQQLAGDAHARQHGDDHRRAQGRSRLRRVRRLRLQRLLPERRDPGRLPQRAASTCS